jgi:hypothetical protein
MVPARTYLMRAAASSWRLLGAVATEDIIEASEVRLKGMAALSVVCDCAVSAAASLAL